MADIIQAAEWLNEGKSVRRGSHGFTLIIDGDSFLSRAFGIIDITCCDSGRHELSTPDLLADDWEIAE